MQDDLKQNLDFINAILVKPGQEPEIIQLPLNIDEQLEVIADILEGNIGSTEFFNVGNGVSLWILVNDFAIPLGLQPNRRMPDKDHDEILFGNIIFIAMYNEDSEYEGPVNMPEHICQMFIEQIKRKFTVCQGDEKPRSQDEIYTESPGTEQERKFKWKECVKPSSYKQALTAGRANLLILEDGETILELNGRYFRQVNIYTPETPLH